MYYVIRTLVVDFGKNSKSLLGDMSPEDLTKYNKYWDDVAEGVYDIPYGMNADEYYQHLKGLDNVDDVARKGAGALEGGLEATKGTKNITINDLTKDVLNTKPKNSPNPEKWLNKNGKTA